MTQGASLFFPSESQKQIYKEAYNFLRHSVKVGRITQEELNKIMAKALKGGSAVKNVDNLIAAAKEITWVTEKGTVRKWNVRHPVKGLRSKVISTINNALERAETSGVRNIEAEELLSKYRENPLFPSQKEVVEIRALRTKGPGVIPLDETGGKTIRPTTASPVVPKNLADFDRAVERVNYSIGRLKDKGVITAEEALYFRQSRGHGVPKGQHGFPNVRNLPSDIFLVPYELNRDVGATLTKKDIHEYVRMLTRMEREGQFAGASKEGLKRLYELNDLLVKNNLPPIKDLEYFKGLPRPRSWKIPPGSGIAIGRTGKHYADVPSTVEKSLKSLNVGGARGKALRRILLGGSALTGLMLSKLGQAEEGPSLLDPVDDFSNVMPSKSGWFGRVAPVGSYGAQPYIDERQARLDKERMPLTESQLQAQQNRAAVGGFLSQYGPMVTPIMSALLPSHEWDVAYSKGGEGSEQGWRRKLRNL